jgi:universal stress protein A
MKPFRRILFATDFSKASERAFQESTEMARENGAELLIAHVYQTPGFLPTDVYMSPAVYEELDAKLRENVALRLQALVDGVRKSGIDARPLVLAGTPYEAIAEAAQANAADLVVMGTHGRTGASRFFLGSVASRVISTAPCPVLTVRAA